MSEYFMFNNKTTTTPEFRHLFLLLASFIRMLCSSILFADNTDLAINRVRAVEEMQEMLNLHNLLHSASRDKVQEEKSKFFSWR